MSLPPGSRLTAFPNFILPSVERTVAHGRGRVALTGLASCAVRPPMWRPVCDGKASGSQLLLDVYLASACFLANRNPLEDAALMLKFTSESTKDLLFITIHHALLKAQS